jgi:hypothetical protein
VNDVSASARRLAQMLAVFLLASLLLNACGGTIETDLTLYTGDRFDAKSRITMPAASLALVGGTEALEAQFKQMQQQASSEGSKFSWRKERSNSPNEVVYSMSISGINYKNLDAYNIQVQKTQYQGQDALSVAASSNYDLSGTQNTVRLHVGKIFQTNNARSGSSTILWTGSEPLQAIVTPKSSTNWLTILLVVLAVAAAAGVAIVVLRRRPSSQVVTSVTASPATTTGAFCPFCGQPTAPGARFCMSCGQAIPSRQS